MFSFQHRSLVFIFCISAALTGCGTTSVAPSSQPVATVLQGVVKGGQQPVSGAVIQLYAVNTSTDSGASAPLITPIVTTGADGGFNISGMYSCTGATEVYLVATGGNPGLSVTNGPVNNTVSILMAALGPCSSLSSATTITLNEVTTAATVFALQSYMTDVYHVGSTPAEAGYLAQDFTLALQLANLSAGTAGGVGVPANSYVPVAKINTVADILSACVNTNGSTATGSNCYALFNATRRNGVNATDTVVAAYNMYVVGQNIPQTYQVLPTTPPFQPTLSAAPTSWAVPLGTVYWNTPSAITYGTAIGSGQENATASIAGSFSYSVMPGTVLPVGTQTLLATFTPTDTADYPTIAASVNLSVNPATPSITWANQSITYGTPLSATQLDATASIPGSFSYSSPAGSVLTAGNNSVSATFTPTDTTDYIVATKTVNIQVAKANPVIAWTAPAGVNFPTALSSTQLNATTSVAGSFVYTPAIGVVMAPGTETLKAVFTPSDTVDYNTITVTEPWTVTLNSPLAAQCTGTFSGTSTAQVLSQALCLWGLQDAASLTASGDTNGAMNVTQDVQSLINGATAIAVPTSFPVNYVPAIPSFSTNPMAQAAEAHYAPIVAGEQTIPFVAYSPNTTAPFNDALELFQAVCTPASALYLNPNAMTSMLNRAEHGYLGLGTSSNLQTGAFGEVHQQAEFYLLLQRVFPSLLLASRSSVWLASLNANNQVEISSTGSALASATLGTAYANNHIRVATSIAYMDMINGTTSNTAMYVVPFYNIVPQTIEPDGGENYIYYENEDFTYHSADVTTIARYYQITGMASLGSIMQQFKTYFALQITQPSTPVSGGSMVAEYYTAPAWKKYWNQVTSSDSIPIVAQVDSDALSAAMLANCGTDDSYRIASYYAPSLTPATIPTNFITYDANVMGARMKQGNFTWAMTTRTTPGDIGKTSYVGGMTLDDPAVASTKSWPLNAAVEEATTQVLLETDAALQASLVGAEYVSTNIKLVNLKANETVAQTTTATFGASTAMYQLEAYDGQPTNWYGQEMWIGTPYRTIGVVRVMTTTAQSDYELNGDIRVVSGNGAGGGVQRPLTQTVGTNIWTFGTMDINLIAHDYATVATELSNTWGDTAQKAAYLKMKDAHDSTGSAYTWPAGTSHYYFAEFYPKWDAASGSPQVLTGLASGLDGFSFVEADGHTYTMLFNKTTSAISYSAPTNATVYPAAIQYRASFVPQGSYLQTLSYSGSIAAQSFVVMVQ